MFAWGIVHKQYLINHWVEVKSGHIYGSLSEGLWWGVIMTRCPWIRQSKVCIHPHSSYEPKRSVPCQSTWNSRGNTLHVYTTVEYLIEWMQQLEYQSSHQSVIYKSYMELFVNNSFLELSFRWEKWSQFTWAFIMSSMCLYFSGSFLIFTRHSPHW